MILDEFKASLAGDAPPGELSGPLKALWLDSRGDWEQAHRTVQNIDSDDAAWVHAYLHRKEGDRSKPLTGIVGRGAGPGPGLSMANGGI